jgi:DNA polymerase I
MELVFQVLDCDYVLVDGRPVVRIFGKTKEGKTVCAFYRNFLPYFYVQPKDGATAEIVEYLKKNFTNNLLNIEEVEKYIPIGYQKKKTKLLKLTLKDPSQTPIMRDALKRIEFVKNIFEADILFKYRFMVDMGIGGMKWVKAIGDSTSTITVKTNRCINAKSLELIEDNTNTDFKYMSIDIEIASSKEGVPDSKNDAISMLSMSFHPDYNGKKNIVLVAKHTKKADGVLTFVNEKKLLEEFLKIIDLFDPDVIVGYNANNFDIPYIVERLRECNLSRAIGRCEQKPIVSKKLGLKFRNSIVGRVVADVYDLVKESVGKGQLKLKRYGLGDVSRELINEDKVGITHSEIVKYWNGDENKILHLAEYAKKDAELALKLLLQKNMLDKFIELSKVSNLLLQDALDGGEAARVENLLLKEFNKEGFVIPLKPDEKEVWERMEKRETLGLKGALVLEPDVGLYSNYVIYLDFKSMYPSIFIAYNICPSTLLKEETQDAIKTPYGAMFCPTSVRRGVLPKIVEFLIKERDRVRKESSKLTTEAERKNLDAKQYALKIMANAFYGYTGYMRARFYVLDIANAITSCGRDLIQRTKEIVEKDKELKVVYGDTDSIMVKTKVTDSEEALALGKIIEKRINDELTGKVQIKIESVFKSLLILSKKRYAGLSYEKVGDEWKEKMIMKGIETVRRDWCDLVSETLYKTLDIILKTQKPKDALVYIRKIISDLDNNRIPIDKLIVTKSISKPIREYKGIQPHIEVVKKMRKRSPSGAPGVGDRVGYVITKGLQLMSDRAEDPEYVKAQNLKVDSKYYIENQIIPPLERVFEAMRIDKTELLGAGKQMLLADLITNSIKKKDKEIELNEIDGFACVRCDKTFSRAPLIGKCTNCGGELQFYFQDIKSRFFRA